MQIIGWILFGFVVGLIARLITPGPNPHGFLLTILLAMAGSLLGGWSGQAIGLYPPGHPAGFFMALLGTASILLIHHALARRGITAWRH